MSTQHLVKHSSPEGGRKGYPVSGSRYLLNLWSQVPSVGQGASPVSGSRFFPRGGGQVLSQGTHSRPILVLAGGGGCPDLGPEWGTPSPILVLAVEEGVLGPDWCTLLPNTQLPPPPRTGYAAGGTPLAVTQDDFLFF